MVLPEMRYLSTLLSLTLKVALLLFIFIEPSPAMQFETVRQTVSGALLGQGLSPNGTAHQLLSDWGGHNKSPAKTKQEYGGDSGGFFDDQSPKPWGGFGMAGDMVYMLPLFTLMDRLFSESIILPITKWPLSTKEENPKVSGDSQLSNSENQPQSGGAPFHFPADSAAQRKDEKTPPEGNGDHIHRWEGHSCPILGCNGNPCCCSICQKGSCPTTFEEAAQRVLGLAVWKKPHPGEASTSSDDSDSSENSDSSDSSDSTTESIVAKKPKKAQGVIIIDSSDSDEEINVRPSYPRDMSKIVNYALLHSEPTAAHSENLADKASHSQALLEANAKIQPIVLPWNSYHRTTVLSTTRIIDWGDNQSYVTIWTEDQSVWSSVKLSVPASYFYQLTRISHNSFVTWALGDLLTVWTETQNEWTSIELLSNQTGHPDALSVLSDGTIVTAHETYLSIWTEVDGVWSSITLNKGSGSVVQITALPENRFLTLSEEKSYETVRLWKKGEEGWTNGIYFQATKKRQEGTEVRGIDGFEIINVSVLDGGSICLLIGSVGPCVTEYGVEVGYCAFIHTSRTRHWSEITRWPPIDSPLDNITILRNEMIVWTKAPYSKMPLASLRTEQPDGKWLALEGVLETCTRTVEQLKDGRLVSLSCSTPDKRKRKRGSPPELVRLKISIKNKEGWSSVEFSDPLDQPFKMFEIRPGLLATTHKGFIKLWDLYNPSLSH